MANVITISSGKGGVGKTSISLNLSLSLASKGFKVCLFDADLGLANVNILTGLTPEHGLEEVIHNGLGIRQIMIKDFHGIDIIPGSSGVEKMADLSRKEADTLIKAFLDLDEYDYFLFDTSAGISAQVLSFCRASHKMILVVTPEPTSLTDAYSLLKVLSKTGRVPDVKVILNQVKTRVMAVNTWKKLKETVQRFLTVKISPLGIVAKDPHVSKAVISHVPFVISSASSPAAKCIAGIADKLAQSGKDQPGIPMELFWQQCFDDLNTFETADTVPAEPVQKDKVPAGLLASQNSAKMALITQNLSRIEERLSSLVEAAAGIKTLVDDVARIKELLSGQTGAGGEKSQKDTGPFQSEPSFSDSDQPDQASDALMPLPKPGKIYLDFDAWMEKRGTR